MESDLAWCEGCFESRTGYGQGFDSSALRFARKEHNMALGDHVVAPYTNPYPWVSEQVQTTVETYEYDDQGRVIKRTIVTTTSPAAP